MYSQRTSATAPYPIRKVSPKSISGNLSAPCTPENWHHLVSIVMKLIQDKNNKEIAMKHMAKRMTDMETMMDHGTYPRMV
jgi:hypothetical protein